MNVERFRRVRTVFERADQLPRGERTDYLDQACAGDAELLGEVRRMLEVTGAPDFLRRPDELGLSASGLMEPPPLPERIGRYHVLGRLGEGGFGVVYRAEEREPVQRTVALKVLHGHRLDERSRLRFEAERRSLARMQHPGIAQIHDAGETSEGQLYYAMELVEGWPITEACDRERLGIEARLELFLAVCAAVQHAHQRGVVHRDLKPSNVIVRFDEGRATAKVIDFGIAKLLFDEEEGGLTREGMLLGTPGYMSPEQATGASVDTRTDVYALGVLLYDLLTGESPFAIDTRGKVQLAETVRILCEEEPRRLSTAVRQAREGPASVAERRGCSETRLNRVLRTDLEWIVRRALAKQPEQRYASVSALIADLERYRRSEPVAAREPVARYLLRKFVARHRLGVGVGLAAVGVAIAGIAGLLWALAEVEHARDVAEQQREVAVRNEYVAHLAAARAALQVGHSANARLHLREAAEEHRGWEWRHLASQCDQSTSSLETGGMIRDMEWVDGQRLIVGKIDRVEIVDSAHNSIERTIPVAAPEFDDFVIDRDAGLLVVDCRDRIELWDMESWTPTRVVHRAEQDVRSMGITPDGRSLVTSENGGIVRVLDLSGERPPRELCRMEAWSWDLRISSDGERVVLGSVAGVVEVRDLRSGRLELALTIGAEDVKALEVSADDKVLFATSGDSLQAWDLERGELLAREPVDAAYMDLHLSRDGSLLYGAGWRVGGRVTAWDSATLEVVSHFHGHRTQLKALAIHPERDSIASGDFDGVIRHWPSRAPEACHVVLAGYDARDLALDAAGQAFATADRQGHVRIWDLETLERRLDRELGEELYGCALGRDRVWVCGDHLFAIDRRDGAIVFQEELELGSGRLVVDPEERWLARSVIRDGRLYVRSLPDLELLHSLEFPASRALHFDVDRGLFVAGGVDGLVRFVDPATGQVVEQRAVEGYVSSIAGHGATVGVASDSLRLFDGAPGEPGRPSRAPQVTSLAFSPRGERLALGSGDSLLRVWGRDGRELLVLEDAPKPIIELHFAAGGQALVGLCHYPGSPTYITVWSAPETVELGY